MSTEIEPRRLAARRVAPDLTYPGHHRIGGELMTPDEKETAATLAEARQQFDHLVHVHARDPEALYGAVSAMSKDDLRFIVAERVMEENLDVALETLSLRLDLNEFGGES